ncbi:Hsp20/alpha crystallin family protein [Aurantibacter sp.]|uniref:Hsp20/alpha crystallin family protein n=1 Tax=Aurantibacter sp. TaxID=2807103 RepID=UPI003264BA1B
MSIVKRSHMLFPELMNEILKPDWFGGIENLNAKMPPVNIKENEKNFELELAVPGRKKEDFKIEIDSNILTVSSEVETSTEKVDENYSRKEFSFTSFKRAFTLPDSIDEENIKADYENGILMFSLPKKEEALPKPKRNILLD